MQYLCVYSGTHKNYTTAHEQNVSSVHINMLPVDPVLRTAGNENNPR